MRDDGTAGRGTPTGRPLAARELLALMLASHGYSAAQIAMLLGWPRTDVEAYLAGAAAALGASNVRGAIAVARRRGLID